jgi:hypothetical protein
MWAYRWLAELGAIDGTHEDFEQIWRALRLALDCASEIWACRVEGLDGVKSPLKMKIFECSVWSRPGNRKVT